MNNTQAQVNQLAGRIVDTIQKAGASNKDFDNIAIEALLLALHQVAGLQGFINILTITKQ